MADLEIELVQASREGAWFIEEGGKRVGEMVYTVTDPQTITIVHTEVGPELRGRGAGQKLVEAAVSWARANGKKVIAQCPFAAATFAKHAELRDVLKA
jgi:predicted GNAT family acetyltransferase